MKSVHVSFRLDNGIPPSPCPRDRVLTPSPSHPRKELRRRKSPIPGSHTPDSSRDSTQQHSSSLESTEGTIRGKKYFTYGDIHSLKKRINEIMYANLASNTSFSMTKLAGTINEEMCKFFSSTYVQNFHGTHSDYILPHIM